MSGKSYVERAVQTDSSTQVSAGVQVDVHAGAPCRTITAFDIRGEPTTLSELILSPPRSRSVSVQDQSAYNDQSSYAGDVDVVEDVPVDMTTELREYKRHPPSYKLQRDRTLKSVSARIVSLPETTPAYSAKRIMERKARVVSHPEQGTFVMYSNTSSPLSDRLDISYDTPDPFVSESVQRTRVRVRSNVTDLPRTPSPPSSPESVVIIADKSQLPKGFLKNALDAHDPSSPQANDDGM